MDLKKTLGNKIIFFDGGMGTMLQARGLTAGTPPETYNISHPDIVTGIHREYLRAGSDIITANTFGAYITKYSKLDDIVSMGLKCVRRAIEEEGSDSLAALDMGPTGRLLKPFGDLAFEECYDIFRQTAVLGEKYGADLVIIETMTDIYEAKAAVLAVKENTSLPVICTMTFDERGRTLTGSDATVAVAVLESFGVDALGINCGFGPNLAKGILSEILKHASIPVLVQPNAGLPHIVDGCLRYDVSHVEFSKEMAEMCKTGALLLGGCCGTTPEHIKETVRICKDIRPFRSAPGDAKIYCSYSKIVKMEDEPQIIHIGDSLSRGDIDDIIDDVLDLCDDGADMICVDLDKSDEKLIEDIVISIQGASSIPLIFASCDEIKIKKALRVYNGKAGIL